jgi:phage shock protein A
MLDPVSGPSGDISGVPEKGVSIPKFKLEEALDKDRAEYGDKLSEKKEVFEMMLTDAPGSSPADLDEVNENVEKVMKSIADSSRSISKLKSDLVVAKGNPDEEGVREIEREVSREDLKILQLGEELKGYQTQLSEITSSREQVQSALNQVDQELNNIGEKTEKLTIKAEHFKARDQIKEALKSTNVPENLASRFMNEIEELTMTMEGSEELQNQIAKPILLSDTELAYLSKGLSFE